MKTSVQELHTTTPVTRKHYNAIRPPDRPLTSILTHAQRSELGWLSVIHIQVRHSTDPSHNKNTDLMSSPRANNPP